jgi:heme-degrading monooxygenase HmoA
MYMRIAWVQTEPGQADAYREVFKRVYSAEKMRSVWLGQAHDNPDSLFIVTHWDSIEAIQEWESSRRYLEDINPKLNAFILGNYSVSVCEVKYAHGVPPTLPKS